jgi:tetratricopeptide (TPR) repeat protein
MERERRLANGSRVLIEASASVLQHEIGKLVALTIVAVGAFVIAHSAAAASQSRRQQDAAEWYRRGTQARTAGRLNAAVDAFQNATAIDRDRTDYRLALASALSAARRDNSARQVLLRVRELTPEDPEVNEQLARLESRSGNVEEAVRYYQAALYADGRATAPLNTASCGLSSCSICCRIASRAGPSRSC